MKRFDPITHRYPRNLEQAFGPGERGNVVEPINPATDAADRLVLIASAVILVAFVAMAVAGWLPGGAA